MQNEEAENEKHNEDTNTTSHPNPLRYMVEEERLSQEGLQGATDTVTAPFMNSGYTPPHPGKRTWKGIRTDAVIGKITGEGIFEQVPQGKPSFALE